MQEASSPHLQEQTTLLTERWPWTPQPGPQFDAYFSEADVLLYGGAAGGGKTSLAVGLCLTQHTQSLFVRREATQLGGVLDHVAELIDPERKGYSGQSREWNIPQWDAAARKIVFGSTPNLGDEQRYQGRARDLLVIDEAANMLEAQVRFLMGWVRTTIPGQRTRTLLCSNPPTGSDGYWLIEMFAPWLDPHHHNPAVPGELRWATTVAGEDVWVDSGEPFELNGELVYPKSRTFIPAKVQDNKFLGTDYLAELQALPEPLRSQMLYGDFTAGHEDGEWQVIPSAWVDAAMDRWEPRELDAMRVTSTGVDPSRGGKDYTIISPREDWYFHKLIALPGHEVPDGPTCAAKVIELVGSGHSPVHVDVIGIGASVVDQLTMYLHHRVVPVNVAERSENETDWSGTLRFINQRAELWWRFRDILNPANGYQVALPRDKQLKAELCSPAYQLMSNGIKIESKVDIIKRLGRSTDRADAVILAAMRSSVMNVIGATPMTVIGQVR